MPVLVSNNKKKTTCPFLNNFTFGIIVRQQLDIKLLSKRCQVWRHHAAGGQVDLVTAGLYLLQEKEDDE